MTRYERNKPAISAQEQEVLAKKKVFVAGCGGLGCFVLELLTRAGVGFITVADADVFSESNLNRQLFAVSETLGRPKAVCAKERAEAVNPFVTVRAVEKNITGENAAALIAGHDIVVDALDNPKSRIALADAARRAGLVLVCGAVSAWNGRVLVLYPNENADFLWQSNTVPPDEQGILCVTVSCVASVQAAETIKVLLSRTAVMRGRLLEFDLEDASWDEIPIMFKGTRLTFS